MKDWTTPVLIAIVLLAGFVAVRQVGATAAAKALAEEAKADAVAFQATADSALALADSLGMETARLEAETARIREESDAAIGALRGRMKALAVTRTAGSDTLRLALPDSLQALFTEHELVHAAELAAAENVIEQKDRQLRAADALAVTLRAENVGLGEALVVQIERGDKWELASAKWEAAASPGFFGKLLGDLPKYAVGVVVGAILVSM